MNKKALIILLFVLGLAAIVAGVIMLRGDEDGWICQSGVWVKHGQPSSAMPTTPCPGAKACTLEAKICPDGSAVGRTGANCEFAACPAASTSSESARIANPASANCKDKGGNSVIKTKPDGSQYSLCYFDDNRACEEWAMMRGECPVGGVKTTGYDTEAQSFCAWSGGSTFAADNAVCTFKDGSTCLAQDFYIGICQKGDSLK